VYRKEVGKAVSRIPTPFIGGTDSPRQDRSAKDQLSAPYVPGADEPAAEDAAPTDIGLESAEETFEPVSAEAAAETPAVDIEALEPEPPDLEVPVPVEWVDGEPEAAVGEEAPIEFIGFEELLPSEEAVPEGAPRPAKAPGPQEVPAAADDQSALPDFLSGPDGGGPEVPIAESEQTFVPPESLEALAEEAERLLQGEQGERIRALMADLGRHGADIAVARAFAAGYLAAKRGEED
jgi:hypothetical protein